MSCGERLAREMKRRGQRITPQRAVILETIAHMERHASAQEVFEQARLRLPGLHLATVYRALGGLQQSGLVDPFHAGPGQTRFALSHEDHPHGHLVCQRCGRTEDFDPFMAQGLAEQVAERHGYQVSLSHLTLRGLCSDCIALSQYTLAGG
jgi:Fur family ferric uptake transcriptional regulator